jgi:hypothetical protein
MVELDEQVWTVDSANSLSFSMLHILAQASLQQYLWKARKIHALLLFLLKLLCLCVHHRIHYGFL